MYVPISSLTREWQATPAGVFPVNRERRAEMRLALVAIVAAGIATLSTQAVAHKPEAKAAIIACMNQAQPRPFRVADEAGWHDYSFGDGVEVLFYNHDAARFYRERCRAIAHAISTAMSDSK